MFLSATEEVGEGASLASNAAISPRTLPLPKRVAAGEAPLLASATRDFGIIDPTLGAYLPLSTRAPLEPLASPTSEFTIMQSWPRLERPLARPGTPMASAPGGSRSDSLPPLAPTPSRASYPRDGSPFVMPDEDGSPTGEAEDTFIPIDWETASAEKPRGAASLLWEKRESVLAGFAPDPPPEPRAAPKARSQDYGTSGQDVFQSLPPAVSESGHYRASLPALALSLAQASMAPPQPVSESGHYRASLPALAFSLAQASMAPPQPARAPIDRPRGGGPLAAESATSGVESRARQPGEPGQALDLDAIAQEVYAILKRRLALERERSWGRA